MVLSFIDWLSIDRHRVHTTSGSPAMHPDHQHSSIHLYPRLSKLNSHYDPPPTDQLINAVADALNADASKVYVRPPPPPQVYSCALMSFDIYTFPGRVRWGRDHGVLTTIYSTTLAKSLKLQRFKGKQIHIPLPRYKPKNTLPTQSYSKSPGS